MQIERNVTPWDGLNPHSFFFFAFLGPHPQHMEALRLGVELEL